MVQLFSDYENLDVAAIDPKALGALVAFLVSGIKGLMTFPSDPKKYGLAKVSHFLVLVDHLQGAKPIAEPVWKLTQKYLLDTIQSALFPGGFEASLKSLDSAADDANWQHQDLSKTHLAKLIETDLLIFCNNRSLFTGGENYTHPLHELPDLPVGKVPRKKPTTSRA
jgi:hypothetical protein